MKKHIRFDSVGGASGDMILSALAALGADINAIEKTINSFFPAQLHFHLAPASGGGLNGLRVTVHAEHHHHHHHGEWPDAGRTPSAETTESRPFAQSDDPPHVHHHPHPHESPHAHRGLTEITALLEGAPLSEATRKRAIDVFTALAGAEAKIHGKTPDTVHFHEVGAWDSVADIVGACLALEQLGVSGVSCGPLPAGTGTIHCAHGEMPNPAPATQELLAGMRVVQTDEPFELVTPTGAALLRTWTHTLAPVPPTATVVKSAFGFGTRTLDNRPNVLRATLLEVSPPDETPTRPLDSSFQKGALLVMETNSD
ncbi:MAG: LarC family nickel insertion protein, partial [Kiritimatiellaeota bacterium]|nr:LarC family nickel insertion protein [Kiritimatiellota bacterium]